MLRLPAFEYRSARTVAEALELLGEFGGSSVDKTPEAQVMLMAGGTDVLPNMKERIFAPQRVVGLHGVASLRGVSVDPEHGARLGPNTTLHEIANAPDIRARYQALAEAASVIATPQIRAQGTLGGNLCLDTRCNYYNQSALWRKARDYCLKKGSDVCRVAPNGAGCYAVSSCDTAPALIALGATVRIASRKGERELSVADLYSDDGIRPVHLHDGEVLTDVLLPALEGDWRSTYVKYRVRGAFDFPIASVAVAALFDGDECLEARVVAQAVATHPLPLTKVETLLKGKHWTPDLIVEAAEIAYKTVHPMDNTSGTIALRRRMMRASTQRALEAVARPGA